MTRRYLHKRFSVSGNASPAYLRNYQAIAWAENGTRERLRKLIIHLLRWRMKHAQPRG